MNNSLATLGLYFTGTFPLSPFRSTFSVLQYPCILSKRSNSCLLLSRGETVQAKLKVVLTAESAERRNIHFQRLLSSSRDRTEGELSTSYLLIQVLTACSVL